MTLTELNWSKKMEKQNQVCSTTVKTDWRAKMRGTERRVGRTTLEKLNSAQGRQAAEHPVPQTLPGAWRMGNVSLLGNPEYWSAAQEGRRKSLVVSRSPWELRED